MIFRPRPATLPATMWACGAVLACSSGPKRKSGPSTTHPWRKCSPCCVNGATSPRGLLPGPANSPRRSTPSRRCTSCWPSRRRYCWAWRWWTRWGSGGSRTSPVPRKPCIPTGRFRWAARTAGRFTLTTFPATSGSTRCSPRWRDPCTDPEQLVKERWPRHFPKRRGHGAFSAGLACGDHVGDVVVPEGDRAAVVLKHDVGPGRCAAGPVTGVPGLVEGRLELVAPCRQLRHGELPDEVCRVQGQLGLLAGRLPVGGAAQLAVHASRRRHGGRLL